MPSDVCNLAEPKRSRMKISRSQVLVSHTGASSSHKMSSTLGKRKDREEEKDESNAHGSVRALLCEFYLLKTPQVDTFCIQSPIYSDIYRFTDLILGHCTGAISVCGS